MCHPSDDMRVGTVCKFGCYTGHELIGYDRIRCFESEQWSSSKPYCKSKNPDINFIRLYGIYSKNDDVAIDQSYRDHILHVL